MSFCFTQNKTPSPSPKLTKPPAFLDFEALTLPLSHPLKPLHSLLAPTHRLTSDMEAASPPPMHLLLSLPEIFFPEIIFT